MSEENSKPLEVSLDNSAPMDIDEPNSGDEQEEKAVEEKQEQGEEEEEEEEKDESTAGRRRSGRARRKVVPLVTVDVPQERIFVVEKGKGKALGSIDAINDQLSSHVSRSKFLKRLHKVMFPSITVREKELKKEMRQFNGFADVSQEHIDAVSKKLESNEVALLKQMAEVLCLERSGKKADLCERISEFLHKPEATKGAKASSKKRVAKRKKSVGGKAKSTPSAYLLYCKSNRDRVKEENPDAAFGEISKILGAEWSKMSDDDKAQYTEEADALKEGSSPPKKRQRVSKATPKKKTPAKKKAKAKPKPQSDDEEEDSDSDSDEDVPLINKKKPTTAELETAIADIVESSDLNQLTMKMVKKTLTGKFGEKFVKENKALIKEMTAAEVERH